MRKPDPSTCYHEAGHAVSAVILEIPIERVDVYRKVSNGVGRVGFCKPKKEYYLRSIAGLSPDDAFHNKIELKRRADFMTIVGPVAQARFEGVPVNAVTGKEGDLDQTRGALCDWEMWVPEAERLLDEPGVWESVVQVSNHLENLWRVDGEAVKNYVKHNIPRSRMQEIRFRYMGHLIKPGA